MNPMHNFYYAPQCCIRFSVTLTRSLLPTALRCWLASPFAKCSKPSEYQVAHLNKHEGI